MITYSIKDIRNGNISLRYLISEGFVKVKLKKLNDSTVHLQIIVTGLEGFTPNDSEINMIRQDITFMRKYADVSF